MITAYIFPGQGAQFSGMGKNLYDNNSEARKLIHEADDILGFKISETMFTGTDEDLRATNITQPAIFIHSVAAYRSLGLVEPSMVAGHSLGEFSALVANGTLAFKDALQLVSLRAKAMQAACEAVPGTMAAVLGLENEKVEAICKQVNGDSGHIVVAANYNCPGQLVISGSLAGVEQACTALKEAGAKRAMLLPVGGAFHSPLMSPAEAELKIAIENTTFNFPTCPVYQNVLAKAVSDPNEIKANLVAQLTSPVKWEQCVEAMITDGAEKFVECGPGKVLQGLVTKVYKEAVVSGVN